MKLNKILESKNINNQLIINTLSTLLVNGIVFLSAPIFARILGPSDFGLTSLYISWVKISAIIFGFQTYASIGTAKHHFKKEKFDDYLSGALSLSLTTSVAFLLVALIFLPFIINFLEFNLQTIILLFITSIAFNIINFFITRFIHLKSAFKNFILAITISVSSIALSFILISIFENNLYLGRIYGYSIPYIILSVILLLFFFKNNFPSFNKKYWKYALTISTPMVFHAISQQILAQTDKVIIQKLLLESNVGIYALIVTFVHLINVIFQAFNNSWVPYYYEDLKENKINVLKIKEKNYLIFVSLMFYGFILVAPEIYKLYSSIEYWEGIKLIPIIAFGSYCNFIYLFPVNYEIFNKKTIFISVGTILAAILNIVLNLILIPIIGIYGAAIGTAISYFMLFVFHHNISKSISKKSLYKYTLEKQGYGFTLFSLMCIIFYVLIDQWIFRWIISILILLLFVYRFVKKKSIF